MIAVQTIKTTWTKASRGGQAASLRNRVPKQLPLHLTEPFLPVIWHSVSYSERNGFLKPKDERFVSQIQNDRFGCTNAEVKLKGNVVVLTYRYQNGAPAPVFFDKSGNCTPLEHSISIPTNCWASIEYNGRYSCIDDGNWWYEHVVINVAFAPTVSPNVFTATEPMERYSQLAILR